MRVLVFLLCFWGLVPSFASAVTVTCADYGLVVHRLMDKHQEYLKHTTRDNDGNAIEFFESDLGTWSLIMRVDGHLACLLGAGTNADKEPWIGS